MFAFDLPAAPAQEGFFSSMKDKMNESKFKDKVFTALEAAALVKSIQDLDDKKFEEILKIAIGPENCFSPEQLLLDIQLHKTVFKEFETLIKPTVLAMAKCKPEDIENYKGSFVPLMEKLSKAYGDKSDDISKEANAFLHVHLPGRFDAIARKMIPDTSKKTVKEAGWTKQNIEALTQYYYFFYGEGAKNGEAFKTFYKQFDESLKPLGLKVARISWADDSETDEEIIEHVENDEGWISYTLGQEVAGVFWSLMPFLVEFQKAEGKCMSYKPTLLLRKLATVMLRLT